MTMRGFQNGWMAIAGATLAMGSVFVGALGCSAANGAMTGGTGDEGATAEGAVATSADALDIGDVKEADYSFVIATRAHGRAHEGYRIESLNGAPLTCADGRRSAACDVATIDFTKAMLGADDASAILAQVGSDERRATIVLVGKVDRAAASCRRDSAATFMAWEVWRAPEPVRLRGNWLHVSHEATQALVVNRWTASTVEKLDFARSPTMDFCHVVKGEEVCGPSHEGVLQDAIAPAGLLVDGYSDGRVVHVNQYFLKIIVGQARLPNGYWLCSAEQFACDDGDCVISANLCDVKTGHGRGLLVYGRTFDAVVQPWLVVTTQLKPTEIHIGP
jgi:hypothetical protein